MRRFPMKMHDDLKDRLHRSADGLSVSEPDIGMLARRGRGRRTRNRIVGGAAAAVLIAGVLVPLWLLFGISKSGGPSSSVAPLSGGEASGQETPSPSAGAVVS